MMKRRPIDEQESFVFEMVNLLSVPVKALLMTVQRLVDNLVVFDAALVHLLHRCAKLLSRQRKFSPNFVQLTLKTITLEPGVSCQGHSTLAPNAQAPLMRVFLVQLGLPGRLFLCPQRSSRSLER